MGNLFATGTSNSEEALNPTPHPSKDTTSEGRFNSTHTMSKQGGEEGERGREGQREAGRDIETPLIVGAGEEGGTKGGRGREYSSCTILSAYNDFTAGSFIAIIGGSAGGVLLMLLLVVVMLVVFLCALKRKGRKDKQPEFTE